MTTFSDTGVFFNSLLGSSHTTLGSSHTTLASKHFNKALSLPPPDSPERKEILELLGKTKG